MTYEMRIERMLDAPAELASTRCSIPRSTTIYTDLVEGWSARRSRSISVSGYVEDRVRSTDPDGPIDFITNVFTAIDRPRRLAYDTSMYVSAWGRTVDWVEEITFEEHDGKTLLTVRAEFETEADRDQFEGGTRVPRRATAGGRAAREGGAYDEGQGATASGREHDGRPTSITITSSSLPICTSRAR